MKRKSPFVLIRREFLKYLYGDAQAAWKVAEVDYMARVTPVFMATNEYNVVVVTSLGDRTFRVTVFSQYGRTVKTVFGASKVYDAAVEMLNSLFPLSIR